MKTLRLKYKVKGLSQFRFKLANELIIFFLLSSLALYFIYSSAINIPFYHHDIYKFSGGGFHQACRSVPGFSFLVTLGRPFSAYIECINNTFGNSLAGIKYLRLSCVFLIAIAMGIFAFVLQRRKISFWAAFFISGSVFCLPAMQTVIVMIAMNIVIAILFAFASYYFIAKSEDVYASHKGSAIICCCFGMGLLLCSFFTYATMPAIFLLPSFVSILFLPLSQWPHTRLRVIKHVLIYGFCAVVFFVLAKLLQMHRAPNGIPSNYRFALNFHLSDRLIALSHSFSVLWNIGAGGLQELVVDSILYLGLLGALTRLIKTNTFSFIKLAQILVALAILLGLSASVYVMAPMDGPPFSRVIFVFQAMALLIVYWSLVSIGLWTSAKKDKIILTCSALLFALGAFYANYDVTLSALNDYTELSYITSNLANRMNDSEPLKRIHIISPSHNSYTGLARHEDIFNVSSTIFAGDITNIVNAALLQLSKRDSFDLKNCMFSEVDEHLYAKQEAECIESAPSNVIVVTYSRPLEPVFQSPNTFILDMNKLILFNTSTDLLQSRSRHD